ncbi:hypothetical protein F511_10351 [Dorcoceras hygrometricum]|uniref:RNA helicase n=1 Tax=Dorcoceras hygrometricum TaxID=472368 RepID=A0A2Z7CQL4_9LAMI|nr:hypothetical protein F511_10351 [Dorcoceras hygrometricum]
MAPKKKHQNQKTSSTGKPTPSTGPKLQLSVENENRLRRLLINSGRSSPSPAPVEDHLSKERKTKRLRSIYEKLSCEGFKDDQIELALSTLKECATYESALDWLCLNISGNELPLRFASGTSLHPSRGSVGVVSTAREDWVSTRESSEIIADESLEAAVKAKGRKGDEALESFQPSQADWIRQYMEQHEEDDSDSWETDLVDDGLSKKDLEPRRKFESIADEYNAARLQAINAKARGDEKSQEGAGLVIRKLKQEMLASGLSVDELESGFESYYNLMSVDALSDSSPLDNYHDGAVTVAECNMRSDSSSTMFVADVDHKGVVSTGSQEYLTDNVSLGISTQDEVASERESDDVELGNFFLEDDASKEGLHPEVLKVQKKEKLKELCSRKHLEKMEGIWKMDAQNRVAAYALHYLFPDLPVHLALSDPYASFVVKLKEGEIWGERKLSQEHRRAGFVDALLSTEKVDSIIKADATNSAVHEKIQMPHIVEDSIGTDRNGMKRNMLAESLHLKKDQQLKKEIIKYKAISVAERVADERCESSPGSNDSLVGYHVRLDSARGYFLLIVLKKLIEKQRASSKSNLKVILMSATVDSHMFSHYFGDCPVITVQGRTHPVSTLFLEDIHENLNYHLASDSLASINCGVSMKEKSAPVGNKRGKKNLVLSGWGDESLLSEVSINPCYIQSNYLNYSKKTQQNLRNLNEDVIDYDLLEDLVCHVDNSYAEGAILVFLPGVAEINMLLEKLSASHQFGGNLSEWLLPLHSSIAPEDQKKVFQKPPGNIRKVIIATNIAETSITVDDVVYVVDCGKHKENRYNPRKKLSSMVEDWISQANARQRRGRAGRVKPGICFCLYTCHRYEKLMRPYQIPEMKRMPLIELCLQVKILSLGGIKQFLLEALEPPGEEAIASAISSLYEVGAIEGNEELTPLGHHLAKLPVDVLIGKMMLYGGIFSCLSPILTISAFLSYKSPFVHPRDERENVDRAKLALLTDKGGDASVPVESIQHSDHLVMLIAYKKWDKILNEHGVKAAQKFCSSHFLSSSVLYMIRDMRIQFGTLLADIGLINIPKDYQFGRKKKEKLDSWLSDLSQPFNKHSSHLVVAIICAGLYPNVAKIEGDIKGRPVWYDGKREVHIHPSSVNSNQKAFQYPFLVFLEKVETKKVFLRDTTIVSPYSVLLFGGSLSVQHQTGRIIVDNWLTMEAPAQTAVLFKELRLTLHSILKGLISKPQIHIQQETSVVSVSPLM